MIELRNGCDWSVLTSCTKWVGSEWLREYRGFDAEDIHNVIENRPAQLILMGKNSEPGEAHVLSS